MEFFLACSTTVQVTMTFGGQTWPIDPADFLLQDMGNNQCIGSFFELTTGGSAPSWIVGDTFLVCSIIFHLITRFSFHTLEKRLLRISV